MLFRTSVQASRQELNETPCYVEAALATLCTFPDFLDYSQGDVGGTRVIPAVGTGKKNSFDIVNFQVSGKRFLIKMQIL